MNLGKYKHILFQCGNQQSASSRAALAAEWNITRGPR